MDKKNFYTYDIHNVLNELSLLMKKIEEMTKGKFNFSKYYHVDGLYIGDAVSPAIKPKAKYYIYLYDNKTHTSLAKEITYDEIKNNTKFINNYVGIIDDVDTGDSVYVTKANPLRKPNDIQIRFNLWENIIKNLLYSDRIWDNPTKPFSYRFNAWSNELVSTGLNEDTIDDIVNDLPPSVEEAFTDVIDLICKYPWHEFAIEKMTNSVMILEDIGDYRIRDWMETHNRKY